MFSQTVYQPQVVAALSQVSSLINSVRQASSVAVLPGNGRKSAESGRHRRVRKREKEQTTLIPEVSVEECICILAKEENFCQIAPLFGIPVGSSKLHKRLGESYVSSETFFENKTGFQERMLNNTRAESFSILLGPGVRQLLATPCLGINKEHIRGFKTKRQAKGTGANNDLPSNKSSVKDGVLEALRDEKLKFHIIGTEHQTPTFAKLIATQLKKTFFVFMMIFLAIYLIIRAGVPGGSDAVPSQVTGWSKIGMGRSEVNPENVSVTFADVKGVDEAKQELMEIVQFLKHPQKFTAFGAKLPKGVLMVGSPGIGKTLLAKAIAGEAGVPFFHASGSEFDELFVGSGSRKVRQLFSAAKARSPCLVFIDEIDSVGAKRTSSTLHPYANQTINQLLSEMDGFSPSDGVIVLGATNKRDNLDSALLRPGRFDMEINILPPDKEGRKEIFKLYVDKLKAKKDLDFEKLAKMTYGMTGADIQNIVNLAALHAALNNKDSITMADMDHARDKVTMGPAWKNKKIDKETNLRTAYHEAGHTVVAYFTKHATPLNKVTILPRGRSLGHTGFISDKENYGSTKAELLARLDVAMGGRIGEEVQFGSDNVTTGASSDFSMATSVASEMVKTFGMSEKVGQRVCNSSSDNAFVSVNNISPEQQQLIDSEINRLLQESYARATALLKKHADAHHRLAKALMIYETLDRSEIEAVMNNKPINRQPTPKPKNVIPSASQLFGKHKPSDVPGVNQLDVTDDKDKR